MGSILLVVFLAASAFAVPPVPKFLRDSRSPDGRIVGGKDINISEVPWQISLQYFGHHIRGGTIISTNWVVTAAHCTNGLTANALSVRAGTSIRGSGGQEVPVAQIHQHPDYNPWINDNDISILKMSSALNFSSDVIAAANLPSSGSSLSPGTIVLVTGWGALSEGGSAPSRLQGVELRIISWSICNDAYWMLGGITTSMLCAGRGGAGDSCQGDSGGPLIYERTLYGVVSWGIGCSRTDYPGVYSNVSVLRGFITDVTGI